MEAELLDMMTQKIKVEPPDGTYTDRGIPNYGNPVELTCRIQPVGGEVIIYGPEGKERKASWKIFVDAISLDPSSRITLPSGFDPQVPPFVSVGLETDEASGHHVVLTV